MTKHLYLVRGVPGSGKSTFAATLAEGLVGKHLETDRYRNEWPGGRDAYPWTAENNLALHTRCQDETYHWLKHGWPVVVSNTFCTIDRLEPYFKIAKELGAKVTVLHVEGRHGSVYDNVDQDYYEREWTEYKGELHD